MWDNKPELLLQTLGNHLKGLEHRKCPGKNWVSGQLGQQVHSTEHGNDRKSLWETFPKSQARQWGFPEVGIEMNS